MNYLAHAYLSFNNDEILVGNIISDYVKGSKQYDYPPLIFKGIRLHRMIDEFTDNHPSSKQAKQIFKPHVGLYASAFLDVAYDHFLANDSSCFSVQHLQQFSFSVYQVLDRHHLYLPARFAAMFPFMKQHDWLFNYRTAAGLKQGFNGLARRAKYLDSSSAAYDAFLLNYDYLLRCYQAFIPDVKTFAMQKMEQLLKS